LFSICRADFGSKRDTAPMNTNPIILSGVHIELTEALKRKANEQLEKLFAHEPRILRIRVELERETNASATRAEYLAKGHVEMKGRTFFVSERTDDLYAAIGSLSQKLDRKLRRYNRRRETDRKHLNPVELAADIPKATT